MIRSTAVEALPFTLSKPSSQPDDLFIVCMQESIGESASRYEAAVSPIRRASTVVHTAKQPVADRSARAAVFVLSVWMTVLVVWVALAGYAASADSHPTDDELTARFLSHEADFQTLARMLDSDRKRLPLRPEPFDLANLVAAGVDTARVGEYESLLAKIDARNFRYFAQSGNVALPVSESGDNLPRSTRSYLYLSSDDPQGLLYYRTYGWRGPGMYFVAGDYRIKGRWFIHHEGIVFVAFALH
jgi:hypothetical protein